MEIKNVKFICGYNIIDKMNTRYSNKKEDDNKDGDGDEDDRYQRILLNRFQFLVFFQKQHFI